MELANLLIDYGDGSDADTLGGSQSSSLAAKASVVDVPADEMPDDLQDLIDGVTLPTSDKTQSSALSAEELLSLHRLSFAEDDETASSFEGDVSSATTAAALALQSMLRGPAPAVALRAAAAYEEEAAGRSSFETSSVRSSLDDARPSYETKRTSFDSDDYRVEESRCNNSQRSSFQDYLALGRPSVGDRMMNEVNFAVPLQPIAGSPSPQSQRTMSTYDRRTSASMSSDDHGPPPAHMPRSARNSFVSLSSVASLGSSPCPTNKRKIRNSMKRYSSVDSSSSCEVEVPTTRPLQYPQRDSLLSISSVASSPCPMPKRRVPMLTGKRLPRPPAEERRCCIGRGQGWRQVWWRAVAYSQQLCP